MSKARSLLSVLIPSIACLLLILYFHAQQSDNRGEDKGEDEKAADELKGGKEREFEIADGVKMKFCWIPPGEAQLGTSKEEQDYITKTYNNGLPGPLYFKDTESSRGKFTTKGFWFGKYPVMQAEWKAVMGANPSAFDGKNDNKAKGMDTSRFPVESVTWDDCQKFLEKLNKRTEVEEVFGKAGQFVLPHEDRWEYACRGGKGNKQSFYFGNELNGTQANCNGNEPYGTYKKGDYKERTTEVGSYAKDWPHPWGLCDMHGNVRQWCDDIYVPDFYISGGGRYPSWNDRAIRGGCFNSSAWFCRSSARDCSTPELPSRWNGFRVCLPLEQ